MEKKVIKLEDLDVKELKALCYDLILQKDDILMKINMVQGEISKKQVEEKENFEKS